MKTDERRSDYLDLHGIKEDIHALTQSVNTLVTSLANTPKTTDNIKHIGSFVTIMIVLGGVC